MNAHSRPSLHLTTAGLTHGLTSATFGKQFPTRWVENADTGDRVGWFRRTGNEAFPLEWAAGGLAGVASDQADALAQIERAVLTQRAWRAEAPVEVEIGRIC